MVAYEAVNVQRLQIAVEGFMMSLGHEEDAVGDFTILQRILDGAGQEAKALGHTRLMPRHLLLAIAFDDESFVGKALREKLDDLRVAAKDLPIA